MFNPVRHDDAHLNVNIQEAEASNSMGIQGQSDLHGEFQVSQNYIVRSCYLCVGVCGEGVESYLTDIFKISTYKF